MPLDCSIRLATLDDAQRLAEMNKALIEDEGHANPMTIPELAERMRGFLVSGYQAWIQEVDGVVAGYCLARKDPDAWYIRQLFTERAWRRRGLGRALVAWLATEIFAGTPLRIEVLCKNPGGIAFWRALGFQEYCITMTRAPQA
jgi:ribosomal protein S18 acetylase RimI-like enzyme